MITSSEFIKGYTEIIVCAILNRGDDYIYNIVKTISDQSGGIIQITNPSMLMVMKKLLAEGKIISYIRESKLGASRRYYSLTEVGKRYYEEHCDEYLDSLIALSALIYRGKTDV